MRLKRKKPAVSQADLELEKKVDSMMSLTPVPPETSPEPIKAKDKAPAKVAFNAMEGFATKPIALSGGDVKVLPQNPPPEEEASEPFIPQIIIPELAKDEPMAAVVDPNIDDQATDQAIDDIVKNESNELLAVQDAGVSNEIKANKLKKKRFSAKTILKNKWFYFALGLLLIILFALPYSRYYILGSFLKNHYQLSVIDSTTNTPVSGAVVRINTTSLTTNAAGQVTFDIGLGKHSYQISKQYYQTSSGSIFVGLSKPGTSRVSLKATGRQVPIVVLDKLSGKPIAGVQISVLNTNAKTNASGQASIVLPTSSSDYLATITDIGYNSVTTRIIVSTNPRANTINLVATGSIYFLSNSSSSINVIKANLDGSDPVVELAGTGSEQSNSTFLLPSPDWKYLVLEAQRSGSQPELYVINTATDQLNEFDSSADTFKLIGWSGDQFIYDQTNTADPTSTAGRQQLKSYNAATQQLNVLDQDQTQGDTTNFAYQSLQNYELLPTAIIYTTQWNVSGSFDLSSSSNTIRGVAPNGLNKKDYYSFPAANTGVVAVARYQPQSLYFSAVNTTSNQTSYYTYTNGAVTTNTGLTASSFAQAYPTYYLSPSAEQTLWSQTNNGLISSYLGDQNGQNQKVISLPAGYSSYGWFDNVYILLSKAGQLYISPATGSSSPILIGSYFTAN